MAIDLGAVMGRLVEIDQIAVKTDMWERAKAGDVETCRQIAKDMDGVILYLHAVSLGAGEWSLVSLREFQEVMPMFVSVKIEIGR